MREKREESALAMSSRRRADSTPPSQTHPPSLSKIFWQKASFDGPVGTTEDVGEIADGKMGDLRVQYTTDNGSLGDWKQDLRKLLLENTVGTQIALKKWNDSAPKDYKEGTDLDIMIVPNKDELSTRCGIVVPSPQRVTKYTVSQGMLIKYDDVDMEAAINTVETLVKEKAPSEGIPLDKIHTKTFFFVNKR